MTLSKNQVKSAKAKIRNHYGLSKHVEDKEMWSEIKNLQRKDALGRLDDKASRLFSVLSCGSHSIDL